MHRLDESLIYEDAYFRVERSSDCCVPGYLILSARNPVTSVSGLTADELQALGPVIALLVRAIEAVVRPDLVYCAHFGEGARSLHFHLFPRTASIAAEFLADVEHGKKLNGPVLLNWAREHHASVTASPADRSKVEDVTQAIKQYIKTG